MKTTSELPREAVPYRLQQTTLGAGIWLLAGACLSRPITALFLAVVAALLIGGFWLQILPPGSSFARLLKRLHRQLPWYGATQVAWFAAAELDSLRRTLLDEGFRVHELDGTRIRCAADLARELEAAFGPRTYPKDPLQKAIDFVTRRSDPVRERRNPRAILLHHPEVLGGADPEALARFATKAEEVPTWLGSRTLLFLAQPSAVPAPLVDTPNEPMTERPEPHRAVLAGAPDDSWWKPRPGELTH